MMGRFATDARPRTGMSIMVASSTASAPEAAAVDWVKELTQADASGTAAAQVAALRQFAEAGRLLTLEPLLPALFALRGKPLTLRDHFPFAPMFQTQLPRRLILKCGRQVSKSSSLAVSGLL